MKQKFDITGMTCSACVAHVQRAAAKVQGVISAEVSLLTNTMDAEFDEAVTSAEEIIAAVKKGGYGASVHNATPAKGAENTAQVQADEASRAAKHRLIASLILLGILMYVAMHHMLPAPAFMHHLFGGVENSVVFAFTQLLILLPILYLNRQYYISGFSKLFHGAPNMDTLIAVGSGSALAYGIFAIFRMAWALGHGQPDIAARYMSDLYFEASGMILTLISLGKFLEARSRGKTTEAISKLMDLSPKTATLLRDGQEVEIPAEDIAVGDILVVRAGQAIPADGTIVEGHGAIDASALTGESVPEEKTVGDTVAAACINQAGYFHMRADKVGQDTAISGIIALVEQSANSKAPISKLADRIAGIFVPVVMSISAVTLALWLIFGQGFEFAFNCAIAVLVISCPCALGLATPVAIMAATGAGASHGILIKSAEAIEHLAKVDTVVLDKTGTLTEGKPRVTDVYAVGMDREALLHIAASLEKPSEHPLASAVLTYAEEQAISPAPVAGFGVVPGKGVMGEVAGKTCLGGNAAFLAEQGIDTSALQAQAAAYAEQGKTPLFFAADGKAAGIIAAADQPKDTSREAIAKLKEMGIHAIMLTGDNARTAAAVQQQLGMEEVIADVLPDGKHAVIADLRSKGRVVAMVGDGINDAPALTEADVGMAVGAGTDIAIESAQVVLIKNDIRDAVAAIALGRKTMRIIRQNLFWAFFYNVIGIPVAAGALWPAFGLKLSPMLGSAAMSCSSVFVVSNALRLRWREGRKGKAAKKEILCTSAVCDTADAQQQDNTTSKGETTMTKTVKIEGMMCMHCVAHVKKALSAMEGVSAVEVSLEENQAVITSEVEIADEAIKAVIEDAGYTYLG